ncbi:hypothetical protein [Jiella sp. M17.18]|uniref:hypothetical protein n=1 Tax=Jiella sp. M17.18 TaxID=3234247 RepID=UPI0034DE68B3
MAERLLARTDEPCKRNFPKNSDHDGSRLVAAAPVPPMLADRSTDLSEARGGNAPMSDKCYAASDDCAAALQYGSQLQPGWPSLGVRVIAGRSYATGFGPIRIIDEIDDIPDALRQRMKFGAPDAGGVNGTSDAGHNASLVRGGQLATALPATLPAERPDPAEPGESAAPNVPAVASGPVFSPEEVRDSRRILRRLARSQIRDSTGCPMLDVGGAPCPARHAYAAKLCAKLAAIGLVRVTQKPSGLIVTLL